MKKSISPFSNMATKTEEHSVPYLRLTQRINGEGEV